MEQAVAKIQKEYDSMTENKERMEVIISVQINHFLPSALYLNFIFTQSLSLFLACRMNWRIFRPSLALQKSDFEKQVTFL